MSAERGLLIVIFQSKKIIYLFDSIIFTSLFN